MGDFVRAQAFVHEHTALPLTCALISKHAPRIISERCCVDLDMR